MILWVFLGVFYLFTHYLIFLPCKRLDGWMKRQFYSWLQFSTHFNSLKKYTGRFFLFPVKQSSTQGKVWSFWEKQDLTNLVIWRPGVGTQHFFTVNFLREKNLEIENFYIIEKNVLPSIFIQNLIAPQTLVKIVIFSIFCAKKLKKAKK